MSIFALGRILCVAFAIVAWRDAAPFTFAGTTRFLVAPVMNLSLLSSRVRILRPGADSVVASRTYPDRSVRSPRWFRVRRHSYFDIPRRRLGVSSHRTARSSGWFRADFR